MFNKKRQKSCREAKKFKYVASELIGVYPILACFFHNILQRGDCECTLEITAFLKARDLMDLIMIIPLGIVSPTALQAAVEGLLEACINAGWQHRFITKID